MLKEAPASLSSTYPDSLLRILPKTQSINLKNLLLRAQQNLLNEQEENQSWNFYPHLGAHFISQYILFGHWLGRSYADMGCDPKQVETELLKTQLADGSWKQLPDENIHEGEINTTIFNYAALKVLGLSIDAPAMKKARKTILAMGGIENSALFTKIILSLFGTYDWEKISYIPYFLFKDGMPIHHSQFAQWVSPHLIAIAYLRHNKVKKTLGKSFDLQELYLPESEGKKSPSPPFGMDTFNKISFSLDRRMNKRVVKKILSWQQPKGSWGGYTLSTILCLMALDHHKQKHPKTHGLQEARKKGFAFVESLYFKGKGAYKGALMDGHIWDTVLSGSALLEAGTNPLLLEKTAEYVISCQQKNGGFPYGFDFEYAPDADDTAEAILFLQHFGTRYQKEIDRATTWLCTMQNRDGGWGAFDRENNGNLLLRKMTKDFNDSVDLFDDSSVDVTAHVMEALSTQGLTIRNSKIQRRAASYLKREQTEDGSWLGRWGVNYIYGTSAAICGLMRAGESRDAHCLQRGIQWLRAHQNEDGGFGESTNSYASTQLAGRGKSTPSQTALALMAFCLAKKAKTMAAKRAAHFLSEEFQRDGKWVDKTVIGTGHPGLLYMNYPVYSYAFPLTAMALYKKATGNPKKPLKNKRPLFFRFSAHDSARIS